MDDQHRRIDDLIRDFDAQGWHRTGTEVDRRSAEWLAEQVRACGLEPELEPFGLSRVVPGEGYVEANGRGAAGLPLFDGGYTGPEGIGGHLGPLGSEAEVGLVEVPPNAAGRGALGDARRAGWHRAIVMVVQGGMPGLAPSNASDFTAPFGPPVLQVSSEEAGWLNECAANGAEVRVVSQVAREEATAYNVVAQVAGRNAEPAPLVVMTPRSGWWQCASERGGGLACWLETMRAVVAAPGERDLLFVASSGHELGHLGLEAYIARRPDLATAALLWLHFGANIGAAQGRGRLLASDDEVERLALEALGAHGVGDVTVAPRGTVPAGEAHNIHVRGGRYLSLVGSNPRFHLQSDRWPEAVDVPLIARYAQSFVALVSDLARGPLRAGAPLSRTV